MLTVSSAMLAGASRKMAIRSLSRFRLSSTVDCAGVARLCSAAGTAENVCGTLETMLCALPAEVPDACPTAAACAADPPGLVFCCGALKGVSAVAAAEEPAYWYIAAASCAHISAYRASVVAIAEVFCPNRLVVTSLVSWARLAATCAGGTVETNASS